MVIKRLSLTLRVLHDATPARRSLHFVNHKGWQRAGEGDATRSSQSAEKSLRQQRSAICETGCDFGSEFRFGMRPNPGQQR